jgi:hypothetical protein
MAKVTRERFEKATTFDQYVERMKTNKEQMIKNTDEVQVPPEDIEWWRSRGKVNVYALTYDGCGDALYNIPVIAAIAKQCPNVDLRVVQRDENIDVMDEYLNQGIYRSVPTFVILDENFDEIGNLKERAESMTRVIEAEMIAIRRRLREENKSEWRDVMRQEFKDVVANQKRYP